MNDGRRVPWRSIAGWMLVLLAFFCTIVAISVARWEIFGKAILSGVIGIGLLLTNNEDQQ